MAGSIFQYCLSVPSSFMRFTCRSIRGLLANRLVEGSGLDVESAIEELNESSSGSGCAVSDCASTRTLRADALNVIVHPITTDRWPGIHDMALTWLLRPREAADRQIAHTKAQPISTVSP